MGACGLPSGVYWGLWLLLAVMTTGSSAHTTLLGGAPASRLQRSVRGICNKDRVGGGLRECTLAHCRVVPVDGQVGREGVRRPPLEMAGGSHHGEGK